MSEIAILIDELRSSKIYICRICHEEEFESCKALESPCACSGTVKVCNLIVNHNLMIENSDFDNYLQFAHRDCVQRWCDEKGNTSCEICLQVWHTIQNMNFAGFLIWKCFPCFHLIFVLKLVLIDSWLQ